MAQMRQQPITEERFSEAEAMRIMRDLSSVGRAHRPGHDSDDRTRRAVLARTFQDEVIPRLLVSRQPPETVRAAPASAGPTPENISSLVDLVLAGNQAQAAALVKAMQDGGISSESLLLDLLTPTARRLGVMWEEDLCDFAEVTIGLRRLANVMRLVTSAFDGSQATTQHGPRALLIQTPGEQHGFGLAMLTHFFHRAGWSVRRESLITSDELQSLVKAEWFSLVGISVACSDRLESLAADIRAIRRVARNPALCIMVGGPPFLAHPQMAEWVGADGTAVDGRLAVQRARSLVSHLALER